MKKEERRELRRLMKGLEKSAAELVEIERRLGKNLSYNPDEPPDDWLFLDEAVRDFLVKEYHQKNSLSLGSNKRDSAHANFHVIAENQLAMIDEENLDETRMKFSRLISEGMPRHEAIHKVAMYISGQIHSGMRKAEGLPILPDPEAEEFEAWWKDL